MMGLRRSKRAQSTLEYVVVLTAIVVLIILVAGTWFKNATQHSLDQADKAIGDAAEKFKAAD